jgi:hypothetical protein
MTKQALSHQSVLELLQSVGPMTSAEVHAFFPLRSHRHVAGVLSRLRLRCKTKQVRICGWLPTDAAHVLAPLYEASDLPCKKRPRPTSNAEKCRAYRERHKPVRGIASVWDLASSTFSE